MDDLISRDFIKSLGGECIAARDSKTHELLPISSIDALPSAQPEPQWIPCSECINYIDERCVVANHHVSEKENCMEVFGAKRRTVERRRA